MGFASLNDYACASMKIIFRFTNNRRNIALITSALFLCLLALPFPVHAFAVTVVKDTNIKAFQEAIQGFTSTCGCTVNEVDLATDDALDKAVKARPDAFFVLGTQTFRKAKAIKNFPVIYTMVMPSELEDLPAGNLYGVSMDISPDASLRAMAKLFPNAGRIGVISDPEQTGPFVRDAAAAAKARGIKLVVKNIHDPQQAPAVLEQLKGKIDVFWLLPDPTFINSESIEYLMLFSFQNSVPVFTFSKKYVDLGAVAALAIAPYDLGVQAGNLARQLSQGGKGPLRAYAANPRLSVNRKVAEKIGIKLDEAVDKYLEPRSNE